MVCTFDCLWLTFKSDIKQLLTCKLNTFTWYIHIKTYIIPSSIHYQDIRCQFWPAFQVSRYYCWLTHLCRTSYTDGSVVLHAIAACMCPPPMLASYARSCSQPSHRHFVISEHNFWKLHMGHRRDSCLDMPGVFSIVWILHCHLQSIYWDWPVYT